MEKCKKCGKSFDSEKGLKIHKAQVHKSIAKGPEEPEKPLELRSARPWILAGIIVLIGIVLMLALGEVDGIDDEYNVTEETQEETTEDPNNQEIENILKQRSYDKNANG